MTKWLIVSDNHTESGILYHLYEVHKDADVLLHLGDSEFEYNDTELSLYRRVKGNCDFYPEFPNEEEVEIKGIKAIYTHGHLYSVNQTRMHLAQKLNLRDVNLHFMVILMFAKYEYLDGVHVINPGSISQSRSSIEETFAELVIDEVNGSAILNYRNRDNHIIETIEFEV